MVAGGAPANQSKDIPIFRSAQENCYSQQPAQANLMEAEDHGQGVGAAGQTRTVRWHHLRDLQVWGKSIVPMCLPSHVSAQG